MKPTTKFEKYIVEIDKSIKPLPDKYIDIAIRENVEHNAFRRADGTCYCFVCGGVFHCDKPKGKVICPHCGKKLDVVTTTKKKNNVNFFWNCLDVHKGLQVLRGYYVELHMRINEPMSIYIFFEVTRTYFNSNKNESVNLSRPFKMNCWAYNPFNLSKKMTIFKDDNHTVGVEPHVRKLIPELKRIGYFNAHEPAAKEHIMHCLWDSHYQTLIEAKQKEFVNGYIHTNLDRYWWQIKMCIRNKYIPYDVGIWHDTLTLANNLGLDIKSPKYVCPANLKEMHDMLVKRKQRKDKEERIRKERELLLDITRLHELFEKRMSLFNKFRLNSDGLYVIPLVSIQDYYDEGEAMNHCVYTNRYYDKSETIIFSARSLNGDRIATIEYYTRGKRILQCRARHNGKVEKEDEIKKLILSNSTAINMLYANAQKIKA